MKLFLITVLLCSCASSKGDSIDNVVEEVISKKEGVDIRIDPIKEEQK